MKELMNYLFKSLLRIEVEKYIQTQKFSWEEAKKEGFEGFEGFTNKIQPIVKYNR